MTLQMCFLLKVDKVFWPEGEIVANLPLLDDAVSQGKIDLLTTDGAISIVFQNEELLGVQFWDEINIPVNFMTAQLSQLLNGQTIERYFPVGSYWMTLTPLHGNLLYKLELQRQQRIKHIVRLLPLVEFAQEFELLFWRMMRILSRLGARSPLATIHGWRQIVAKMPPVNDLDKLQWVIEQPLEEVLRERGFR